MLAIGNFSASIDAFQNICAGDLAKKRRSSQQVTEEAMWMPARQRLSCPRFTEACLLSLTQPVVTNVGERSLP